MKRSLLALLAGVVVFGAVLGLAASLNLTTDTLGAGNATVAACQATPLNTSYTTTYVAGQPGYQVTTVTVSGVAATCQNKAYKLTLSGAANASLGEQTGTTPATTTFTGAFTVNAASVTGVSLVISG
jgi:hypothetical protein